MLCEFKINSDKDQDRDMPFQEDIHEEIDTTEIEEEERIELHHNKYQD